MESKRTESYNKMKRKIFLYVTLICSIGLFANNEYSDLLTQEACTYWCLTKSICNPQWNVKQAGLYFAADSLFSWYKITDLNDTISLYDGIDTEVFIDHRSYKLCEDSLFVIEWHNVYDCCSQGQTPEKKDCVISEAYKIVYLTTQKLVLVQLQKDSSSTWAEYLLPPCNELNILEFDHIK